MCSGHGVLVQWPCCTILTGGLTRTQKGNHHLGAVPILTYEYVRKNPPKPSCSALLGCSAHLVSRLQRHNSGYTVKTIGYNLLTWVEDPSGDSRLNFLGFSAQVRLLLAAGGRQSAHRLGSSGLRELCAQARAGQL